MSRKNGEARHKIKVWTLKFTTCPSTERHHHLGSVVNHYHLEDPRLSSDPKKPLLYMHTLLFNGEAKFHKAWVPLTHGSRCAERMHRAA